MASYSSYNFGVEIETVVKPYANNQVFTEKDWYRLLAQKLENRGIPAVPDDLRVYRKHPEYYGGKWFITKDGSLNRSHPSFVTMEVVSPKLNTTEGITKVLSEFWEAMSVHFDVQRESTCGGHVHVTPLNGNDKFSMAELRNIAFAIVVYEDCINSVLPSTRKINRFCIVNTQSSCKLSESFRNGKSSQALKDVNSALQTIQTEKDLHSYMQASRYVLWNFQNIFPDPRTGRCSGTVEFRGGDQFLNTKGILRWVAFVVSFIALALGEDLMRNKTVSYISPFSVNYKAHLESWWKNIRGFSQKLKLSRFLPEDYSKMQKN